MTPTSDAAKRKPLRVMLAEAAPPESFHDCYVHGLRWSQRSFSFIVDLDYIVQWVAPSEALGSYCFLVSRASLVFENADDVSVTIDWAGAGLEAQLSGLRLDGERSAPSGVKQQRYVLEFSNVDGGIALWATRYEVHLWTEPERVSTPYLVAAD